jgi:hypothetical protein
MGKKQYRKEVGDNFLEQYLRQNESSRNDATATRFSPV